MNTLKTVKIGQTVKVVKLHGEGAVKRRIWLPWPLRRGGEAFQGNSF